MKLRVAFGRRQSVLGDQLNLVEVDRDVEAAARRIDVHHFDIFAARPGRQRGFPGDVVDDAVDADEFQFRRQLRIERVAAQTAPSRPRADDRATWGDRFELSSAATHDTSPLGDALRRS